MRQFWSGIWDRVRVSDDVKDVIGVVLGEFVDDFDCDAQPIWRFKVPIGHVVPQALGVVNHH